MKNKLLVLVLLLICIFSFNVFAEESGKLIVKSGDGTKLGDEVCIGDQCFYVIENNGETAKLLSKYNLYNGWVYNYEDVYQETTDSSKSDTECYWPYSDRTSGCWQRIYEKTGLSENDIASNGYTYYELTDDNGKTYFRIYYFTYLDSSEFKQSSESIGAHGNERGEPEFPEIAVFNTYNSNFVNWYAGELEDGYDSDFVKDGEKYSNIFQDYNFKKDIYYFGNRDYKVLSSYEDYLDDQGLSIQDINILSLSDINNIAKTATGSELPLDKWANNPLWIEGPNGHDSFYVYGSLKEELGDNYSWLWATTYFLRTYDYGDRGTYLMFVDTLGDVCSNGWCQIVGAGIRPVIAVDSKDIYKEQPPIVNPETGGVIALTILGLLGIGLFSFKLNKKNN